jgi:hypothetical protein
VPKGVLTGVIEELRGKWQLIMSTAAGRKGCTKGGEATLLQGVGIHSPGWHDQEWVTKCKRETGLRAVQEQTGVHAPGYITSPEARERSRQTALRNVELGKGIHGLTPEERGRNTKRYMSQFSAEELSEKGKQNWANLSKDERSDVARRSAQTVRETYTPEQILERNRKIARANSPRPVILITPVGEEIYYELLYDACREHNLNSGKLGAVCKGTRKTHKGYKARYAD